MFPVVGWPLVSTGTHVGALANAGDAVTAPAQKQTAATPARNLPQNEDKGEGLFPATRAVQTKRLEQAPADRRPREPLGNGLAGRRAQRPAVAR